MATSVPPPATALVFEAEPWEQAYLRQHLPDIETRFHPETLTHADCRQAQDATILCVFIWSRVDRAVLDCLPNLRMITTRSTGFDHIDLDSCRERGIPVSNVPTYGENTVAEHTFALILALTHKLIPAVDRTRRSDFSLEGLRGHDLQGRTLGIVGVGSIGRFVARIAGGFGMPVLAYDPFPEPGLDQRLGFRWVSLDDLLSQSDIVTLHCPLNAGTRHLLNAERIARMKAGSYLINTARGGVVDTEALVRALVDGHLAGAGLDVLEEEGLIKEETQLLSRQYDRERLETLLCNHMLLQLPNVIVTPHNAFNTQEALQRILHTTVANIRAFLAGQPCNRVA